MKRLCFILGFLCLLFINAIAQPKSVEYEKQDFLLNVLTNPSLTLCGFKDVGLNTSNTSMDYESTYLNTKNQAFHKLMIQAVGRDDYNTRKTVYKKVAASWKVFKEIQNRSECVDVHFYRNDISAPQIDPVIRHKLSIIPLKLEKY